MRKDRSKVKAESIMGRLLCGIQMVVVLYEVRFSRGSILKVFFKMRMDRSKVEVLKIFKLRNGDCSTVREEMCSR